MITVRILYILSSYGHPNSRAEKEIYSLSKEHDVDFLGWDRNKSFKGITKTRIRINDKEILYYHIGIKAPTGEGFKKLFFLMLRYWLRVWKFLIVHKKEYDALHICDFDSAVPVMFVPGHIKRIYDIFDYYADTHQAPAPMAFLIRKLENHMIRTNDATIICSETRSEQIYPAIPRRLAVIHNTPSALMAAETQLLDVHAKDGRCRIVYIGVLSEDRFLREICEVVAARKDVELHIGGAGILGSYIFSMAQRYDNIFYYGVLNYPRVLDLEKRCDIMTAIYDPITPNHKYAAPNKFYEALMQRKPLIMIKNTGMDSYVSQYDLGEVIDLEKITFKEGFSSALSTLLERKGQWNVIGERGYELYQSQFSWQKMEKRLLELYEKLEHEFM